MLAYMYGVKVPALKFIPARGRKPVSDEISSSVIVEIYPREGTETRGGNTSVRNPC